MPVLLTFSSKRILTSCVSKGFNCFAAGAGAGLLANCEPLKLDGGE
jgi:hypothetical protein